MPKKHSSDMSAVKRCVTTLTQSCLFVLALTQLTGCFGPRTLQDSVKDYRTRLSYVLDTPLPEMIKPTLSPLPDSTSLKYTPEGVVINLREFYALQACELGSVVAMRNTALGKSQLASQRLVYESELLVALSQCAKAIEQTDQTLAATLANWHRQKRADFALNWANVIQTSLEFRVALNNPERLLWIENNKDAAASINSLYYVDSLMHYAQSSVTAPIDSTELEQQLNIIRSARLPATLWQTQLSLSVVLLQLNSWLPSLLDDVPCPEGRASEKAKILRNVFYLFFIEEIQPVGSLLNQYHYKLAPLWSRWIENEALRSTFKDYLTEYTQSNYHSYRDAMQTHVTLWQTFLGRCHLSPVAPSAT
ncbi:DUF3080 family protein [Alteromonas sp. D210916BOD_24]|uniref:DUF3080 family protein n=1 Tax=Alteromonas sp. D210916BOD_24 TaxID=3157618 RepID=UPI00399CAB6E